MMLTGLVILGIVCHMSNGALNNAYPDYKTLTSITLPTPLQQHIATYYNDKIYILGGTNATFSNVKVWSMDVSGWSKTLTSDNLDIANQPTGTWTLLNVADPTYGQSGDGSDGTTDFEKGEFYCTHQCSAQIGQYLYIAASETDNYVDTQWLYRLDLAVDPPTWATAADINEVLISDIRRNPCVTTDGTDLYYMSGGGGSQYSVSFNKYDVENDRHESLNDMGKGRRNAGCSWNVDNSRLYIFGGQIEEVASGIKNADWYTKNDQSWTNLFEGNCISGNCDSTSADLAVNSLGWRCPASPLEQSIECAGGGNAGITTQNNVFNTNTESQKLANGKSSNTGLVTGVTFYGFVRIPLDVNAVNAAYLNLILGGANSGSNPIDEIQYAVRYGAFTEAPSQAPNPSPTPAPSKAPSKPGDTPKPSVSPTPPTTSPTPGPTNNFTTASPTKTPIEPSKDDMANIFNGMIAVLSAIFIAIFMN